MASDPGIQLSRAYQLEMFEASMKENIIVAMATGSGKTHIAAMRLDMELRRTPSKRVWFTAPNVVLAEQQFQFLTSQLPMYQMRTLLGHDNVRLWETQKVWDCALSGIDVVISTPMVLLEALRNAFVHLRDISLLIIDEAHHCQAGAPSALTMREYYHPLKEKCPADLPCVLGLTASLRISRKTASITELESTLNAVCRTPTRSVDDYALHVYRPQLVPIDFKPSTSPPSLLLVKLETVIATTLMKDDPYYQELEKATDLSSTQKLAKIEKKKRTPAMQELKALLGNADDIIENMGSWASDKFVKSCALNWHNSVLENRAFNESTNKHSPQFIDDRLSGIRDNHLSYISSTTGRVCDKAQRLIDFLVKEYHIGIAVIIFVERRSSAYALSELLRATPELSSYRIFPFVGLATSNSTALTEVADRKVQKKAFADFRAGSQDICIATSVAEEGVDIQAVNLVIRYDDPKQFVAFLQSRGRARRQESKFVYFRNVCDDKSKYSEWARFEAELDAEYKDEMRVLECRRAADVLEQDQGEQYIVSATGASLQYDNATQHLQHFCAIESKGVEPIYVLEIEADGLMKAKVVLPSCVPVQFQNFTSKRAWLGEKMARRDAAFQAYKALHEAGLVSDNLVPFQPDPVVHIQTKQRLQVHTVPAEVSVWHCSPDVHENFAYRIEIKHCGKQYSSLVMILPIALNHVLRFPLDESSSRTLDVDVVPLGQLELEAKLAEARLFTKLLFEMLFLTGSATKSLDEPSRLPLLMLPEANNDITMEDTPVSLRLFLKKHAYLLDQQPLLIWKGSSPRPYVWHPPHIDILSPGDTPTVHVKKIKGLQIYTGLQNVARNGTSEPQLRHFGLNECNVKPLGTIYGPSVLLVPSILHIIAAAVRAQIAQQVIFKSVGFSSAKYLVPALLAKSASGGFNYERLEFLGDTYLKFRASLQMFSDYPLVPEGVLSQRVHDLVCNSRLDKSVRELVLEPFVTTEAAVQKHWKLPELAATVQAMQPRKVASKTLADVVESTLAAAYLEGEESGHTDEKCSAMLRLYLSDVEWKDPIDIVRLTHASRAEHKPQSALWEPVEAMLGHDFSQSSWIQEAFTHSAAIPGQSSLDRLEFLGDAIIDVILKAKLFEYYELGPDQMTVIRAALASHVYMAFSVLGLSHDKSIYNVLTAEEGCPRIFEASAKVYITDLIRFNHSQLREPINAAREGFNSTKIEIAAQLQRGVFPWTLLRGINAPKVCSDVLEAIIAAVYLDTGGSLAKCEEVLDRLGMIELLHNMATTCFEVRTPAARLREVCAKQNIVIEVKSEKRNDGLTYVGMVILRGVDGRALCEYVGTDGSCDEAARSLAAEIALAKVIAGEHKNPIIEDDLDIPSTQDSAMTGMGDSDSEEGGHER